MVGDVLSKDNERNRHIRYEDGEYIGPVQLADALERADEGEIGESQEGLEGDSAVGKHIFCKDGEVDDLERVNAGAVADDGEYGRNEISCEDADDERDELEGLLAVGGAEHGHGEGDKSADQRGIRGGEHDGRFALEDGDIALEQIADGVSGKGESDDRDGRADDDGGHDLIDPVYADELDNSSDDDIYESGEECTDDEAEPAERHRNAACEGCEHGVDECERRAEEDRALSLGEQQVNQSADAGAEHCGGRSQAVADDHRDRDGGGENGEHLLERKDHQLAGLGFGFYVESEFHCETIPFFIADSTIKKALSISTRHNLTMTNGYTLLCN